MNEELELEKLNDLAIHYPVYLIDAAAEHFNGDECKLEAIAVVLSGLDALCMPSSALLFVQVLSRMMDLEVELPSELMDDPYLCAWFMRRIHLLAGGVFGGLLRTVGGRVSAPGAHIHSCLIQTA